MSGPYGAKKQRIAELYSDDKTYREIAAEVPCAENWVQRYATNVLGICRKPRMTTKEHSMILGLRKQGMSMIKIARKMGYSQTAIAQALRRPLRVGGD